MTNFLTRKLDKFIEGRVNHHTNYPMVDKYDRETLKDFTDEDLKALSLDLSYYIMGSSPELFERAHDIQVATGLDMVDSYSVLFDSHGKLPNSSIDDIDIKENVENKGNAYKITKNN